MIPPEVIDEIRKRADIVKIIQSYIDVVHKGNSYTAVCPFHSDKNPSLQISQDKQIYKCFSCGAGGNVFTFVSEYEKIPFVDSVKKVAELIDFKHESLNSKEKIIDKSKQELINCVAEANNIYKFSLNTKDGENAKDYFLDRNINQDMIDYFSLGYSPSDPNITINILRNKGYSIDVIDKAGILSRVNNSYLDRFSGRVMFPIFNEDLNVIGFSGRKIKNTDEAKYVNSPSTSLFNKSAVLYNYQNAKNEAKKEGYVYIVEGFMDVFALYKVGIKSSVALMGTAFTSYHAKMLRRLNVELRLCLDGDDAGQHGIVKMMEILEQEGLQYKVVNYGNIKDDPDEILQKEGPVSLKTLLNNLSINVDFIYNYYKKDNPLSTLEEKKRLRENLIPFIKCMKVESDKNMLITKVSKVTFTREEDFKNEINTNKEPFKKTKEVVNREIITNRPSQVVNRKLNALQASERNILYFLLTNNQAISDFQCSGNNYFIEKINDDIYNYILEIYLEKGQFEFADFITKVQQSNNPESKQMELVSMEIIENKGDMYPKNYTKDMLDSILNFRNTRASQVNKEKSFNKNIYGKDTKEQAEIFKTYVKKEGK